MTKLVKLCEYVMFIFYLIFKSVLNSFFLKEKLGIIYGFVNIPGSSYFLVVDTMTFILMFLYPTL